MAKARISSQAREDLDEIWVYIAPDDLDAADRMIEKLLADVRKIARHPGVGRGRPEIESGIRSWPCGNYVIYYRFVANTVDVLHFAHGARSIESLFSPAPGSERDTQ